MKIAIHQPNFIPWMPFFQKMDSVDLFVLLTHCQYEKGGYQNRFQARGAWHTMSVRKGMHPIADKLYKSPGEDWDRIKATFPELYVFDDLVCHYLRDTNCEIIRRMAKYLGVRTKIITDEPTKATSTARLVEICKRHNADTYLAGSGGSRDYLEVAQFEAVGIAVEFQAPESLDRRHVLELEKIPF